MYINKLYLRAFGKFASKKINFENNFNIIYGENEAGKSTVHNFIAAVLYGFDNDEAGTTGYNKYKPWNSNLYKGSINIKDYIRENYIVSKDFLLGITEVHKKNNDEPEMYQEDITSPGERFFNMNKVSFNNTVSVRQLGNKTDSEIATELKNKIINLSKTRDESISIDRILQRLNNIKDEAGDENNDKTLLGQYSIRLSELKTSWENSINANRQVMFLVMEKKKMGSKIQDLNMRVKDLKKELKEYELSIEKDKFLRAEPVKKELDEINSKLLNYNKDRLKKYSDSDFKEAINIEIALNSMYSQRKRLSVEKEEKEEALESLLTDIANKIDEQFNIDKLNNNYKKFESNNTKIKDLKAKILSGQENIKNINIEEINDFLNSFNKTEEISRKIDIIKVHLDNKNYEQMTNYRISQIKNIVLIVVLGVILTGGVWWSRFKYEEQIINLINQLYTVQQAENIAAGIVTALIVIILFLVTKPIKNRLINAKNEIDSMECEFADYTISLENLFNEKRESIKETGCDNFDDMIKKLNNLKTEKSLYEEKNKLINYDIESLNVLEQENDELKSNIIKSLATFHTKEINAENIKIANEAYLRKDSIKEESVKLKSSIDQLRHSIVKLDKEISFEEKRFDIILSNNEMDDLDSFRKAVDYSEKYTDLINSKDYKESILHKIIGDENFDDLKEKTKNVNFYEVIKLDSQAHQLRIFKLNDEKSKYSENIDNIVREIDEIENSTRSLVEIEEEIDFYENKINMFKRKIKIVEIAAEKIIKISDSIKGDFMPLLRKSISDNFAYLTGGKYPEVVIDEEMNITVVEEDNKERKIELESLSGGTLDQLYLALRVALGNILSGNQNIPLIFDDSFVQYDSRRLKNSIKMLAKESERRQIILFTCQEREADLAKQMNIKFNHIKL